MNLVSNFGDVAILVPASIALIVFLIKFGPRGDATAYATAATASLIAALFAKLAFAACGGSHALFDVESPSGHAAFATTFYGCLAALLGAGQPIGRRLAAYGGAAGLILLIGMSRIAIGAHTVPEVGVGLLIGGVAVVLFNVLRIKPARLELTTLALVRASPLAMLFALCFLLFGDRWTAEPYIDAVAMRLGVDFHLCR